MFGIGWSEILLIGVVALMVFGPEEFPKILRGLTRTFYEIKRSISNILNF